jgi:hypothetical protein
MIIATTLSHAIVVGESNDPIIEKETHIAVYGRNIIPIKILNFMGPNFGTNHSLIRLTCSFIT